MTELIADRSAEALEWFPGRIQMPYTLTPGRAAGVFLAELAGKRIIGSRHGATVLVPAQDFSGADGAPLDELVEVAPTGAVESFTETSDGVLAFIRLDGADTAITHRIVDADPADLKLGARVHAVWADERSGAISDLSGFRLGEGESFAPRAPGEIADPVERVDYTMTLDYEHAYGHYYGTLFDGIKHDRRVRGIRCSKCERVLLPPREYCDVCYAPTLQWVDVDAVGTIQASSVVHVEFIGQRMQPPYVYAEIVLDGTHTRLIHMVGGVDPEEAKTKAAPGARVQAVWSDRRTGSLADIDYFEVIDA